MLKNIKQIVRIRTLAQRETTEMFNMNRRDMRLPAENACCKMRYNGHKMCSLSVCVRACATDTQNEHNREQNVCKIKVMHGLI